jgi:hypothetical protein
MCIILPEEKTNMEVLELKSKLHGLIDEINNYAFLENFYRIINFYRGKEGDTDIVDELTERQKVRLKESILQAQSGRTIPHKEVREEINQWLSK